MTQIGTNAFFIICVIGVICGYLIFICVDS